MILGGINSTSNAVAGTQSADDQARLEEDLNQFLTLLVTQLENQDPLDPMDSTEFTSQLVQFASVEQQIKQNTNLEQLVGLQQNNQISSMVNFIDKLVEVEGQSIPLEDGQAEFTYTLPVNEICINYHSTKMALLFSNKKPIQLPGNTHLLGMAPTATVRPPQMASIPQLLQGWILKTRSSPSARPHSDALQVSASTMALRHCSWAISKYHKQA